MTRPSTLPVVAIGKDKDGLPTRLSVPAKVSRPVAVVSNGQRIGTLDPSGVVKWTPAGSAGSWREYVAQNDALKEAARARRRLRASIIDGNVAPVVAPPRRGRSSGAKQ